MTRAVATTPSHHSHPQERNSVEGRLPCGTRPEREAARDAIRWSSVLGTMDRLPQPRPDRGASALARLLGPAAFTGATSRPSARASQQETPTDTHHSLARMNAWRSSAVMNRTQALGAAKVACVVLGQWGKGQSCLKYEYRNKAQHAMAVSKTSRIVWVACRRSWPRSIRCRRNALYRDQSDATMTSSGNALKVHN